MIRLRGIKNIVHRLLFSREDVQEGHSRDHKCLRVTRHPLSQYNRKLSLSITDQNKLSRLTFFFLKNTFFVQDQFVSFFKDFFTAINFA